MRFGRTVAGAAVFPVALASSEPRTTLSPVRTAVAVPGGMIAAWSGVGMRAIAAARTAFFVGPVWTAAFAVTALGPVTERPVTKAALALRTCFRSAIAVMRHGPAFANPVRPRPLATALIAPCIRTLVAARTLTVPAIIAPTLRGPRTLVSCRRTFCNHR